MHLKLVNLGCGHTHHPAWINLDLTSNDPQVIACDLRKGIPFSENTCDAVYHSHVLEHIPSSEASGFIKECCRVLKPGAVLRVVVPNLEQITQLYLKELNANAGDSKSFEHEWMTLELLDQMTRAQSGGLLRQVIRQATPEQREFIAARFGHEAEINWRTTSSSVKPFGRRLLKLIRSPFPMIKRSWTCGVVLLVKLLGGSEMSQALRLGLFRQSGEVHQWMYDRVSLARLLARNGFREIRVCSATESRIPGFAEFNLDADLEKIRKPDSLFIEGVKL